MKKKKQLTSLLLASAMLLSMLPIQAAAADTVGDTAPETVVVSGTEDLPEYDSYFSSGEISMPQLGELANSGTVDGYSSENPVSYSFNPDTKTMTLQGTGTLSESHTRKLSSLLDQTKNVIIENGITEIASFSFDGYISIQNITLPQSLTTIGYRAFRQTSITSIAIPDSVGQIMGYAFWGTPITSLHIPSKVADISYETFSGCNQLTDISFGDGSNFTAKNGAVLDQSKNNLIYVFHAQGEYSIPAGIETIDSYALCNQHLTTIVIPKSVNTIKDYAAYCNVSLTTVTFEDPSTTVFFGTEVFAGCTALSSINLPNPVADHTWYPDAWPNIERIAELGYHMFEGCSSLKTISIPSPVKTFYNAPFSGSGLTSVTIPNGTTTIAAGAFRYMSNLASVSFPTSVTTIECTAFGGCDKIVDVYYCGTQVGWNQITIDSTNALGETDDNFAFGTNKALINATVHYGHRWSDWIVTKSPTLEEEGEQARTCTTCGATDTAGLDKLPCPFTDVTNPKAYYYDAVLWAVDNGVTNGTTTTTFSPNDSCNRGQIVVFLWRLAGKPTATNRNNPFTDVKEGDYCYEAVLWAVENGITNGATTTTFAPRRTCNRGEIVTFLWRYAGKPQAKNQKNQFTDVKKGSFCYDAVLWAVENKITLGRTATTFEPKSTCVRGHAVTFLFRAKDLFGQQ